MYFLLYPIAPSNINRQSLSPNNPFVPSVDASNAWFLLVPIPVLCDDATLPGPSPLGRNYVLSKIPSTLFVIMPKRRGLLMYLTPTPMNDFDNLIEYHSSRDR